MALMMGRRAGGRRGGFRGGRLIVAAIIAVMAIVSYLGTRSANPVTGERQYVAMSVDEEIRLGVAAAPEMADRFGGLHPDAAARATVDRVGRRLLEAAMSEGSPYPFEFHLLADPATVNAFALPGGQVFITAALYERLESEGQLAGVLGHEIGHVIERHAAQRMAQAGLVQGLVGATAVATYDPERPGSAAGGAIAAAVGQMVTLKYGRDEELESDRWGVRLMAKAGYDPRSMVRVMEILRDASGGGGRGPEFFSTHPAPENRIERIRAAVEEEFPRGVPEGLIE